MKNSNGFTLFESLAAFSLLLTVVLILFPSITHVRLQQKELSIERDAISSLHDELHNVTITPQSLPLRKTDPDQPSITYTFNNKEGLIEGCATWKTRSQKIKEVCLYGVE